MPVSGARLGAARATFGEVEAGHEPHEIVETSGLTSIMGNYVFTTSGVRVTSHELYQRQGDGTYRLVIELFGFRDPLR